MIRTKEVLIILVKQFRFKKLYGLFLKIINLKMMGRFLLPVKYRDLFPNGPFGRQKISFSFN